MDHFAALPKRDNDQYIASYAREQRRYLKIYAAAGQSERTSWAISTANTVLASDPRCSLRPESQDDVFLATPILQARTEGRLYSKALNDHGKSDQKSTGFVNISSTRAPSPASPGDAHSQEAMYIRQTEADTKVEHAKQAGSRKNVAYGDSGDDEAQEIRLAERRRRKKLKKEMMKSDVKSTGNKKGSSSNKKKENSAQLGFALMHGFSATNVGKSRLTLDHLIANRKNGVFKKGKASDATKVIPKNSLPFIESRFLNVKRKPATSRPSESVSVISQSSTRKVKNVVSKRTYKQNRRISGKGEQQSTVDKDPSISSSPLDKGAPQDEDVCSKYNPDDSIIWDIEKSSKLSPVQSSSEHGRGTIHVNAPKVISPRIKHCVADVTVNSLDPPLADTLEICQPDASGSILSLGPSQSASQLVTKPVPCLYQSSRYFPSILKAFPPSPVKIPGSVTSSTDEYLYQASIPGNQSDQTIGCESHLPRSTPTLYTVPSYPAACSMEPELGLDIPGHSREIGVYPESGGEYYWSEIDLGKLETPGNYTYIGYDQCSSELAVAEDDLLPISDTLPTLWTGSLMPQPLWDEHFAHTTDCGVPQFPDGWNEFEAVYDILTQEPGLQAPESLQDQWKHHLGQQKCCVTDSVRNGGDCMGMANDEASQYNDSRSQLSFISCNSVNEESELGTSKFYQGRALLHGHGVFPNKPGGLHGLVAAEAEVASLLKRTHWLPQKF